MLRLPQKRMNWCKSGIKSCKLFRRGEILAQLYGRRASLYIPRIAITQLVVILIGRSLFHSN